MTAHAHGTRRGHKRATANGTPPAVAKPRTHNAGATVIARLRRGPATNEELTRLIYGAAPPKAIHTLIGALRQQGYTITHDWEGYHLVSEPTEPLNERATRTPGQAIYALMTTRTDKDRCDCGRAATGIAIFYSLTADGQTRYRNALPVCESCAAAFTDAEQIILMEEAYALANIPIPKTAQSGRPRGRPASSTDCARHDDASATTGADAGASGNGATGRLSRRAGRRHAPAG